MLTKLETNNQKRRMPFTLSTRTLTLFAIFLLTSTANAFPVTLNITTDGAGEEASFGIVLDPFGTPSVVPFNSHSPMDPDLFDGTAVTGDLDSLTSYNIVWDLAPGSYMFTVSDAWADGGAGGTLITPTGSFTFISGTYSFAVDYLFDIQAEQVPTPLSLALFGLGLAALAWSRRHTATRAA